MKTNGKLWSQRASLAGILALVMAGAGPALAGEPDEPGVVGDPHATEDELTLPEGEASRAEEDAAFGLGTADEALDLGAEPREDREEFGAGASDGGAEFGQGTAGDAKELGTDRR